MRGQQLGEAGMPEGVLMPPQITPQMQRALEAQEKRAKAEADLMPTKGEQRRLAAVQFAVQAGTDPENVVKVAKAIDTFISTGPNG